MLSQTKGAGEQKMKRLNFNTLAHTCKQLSSIFTKKNTEIQ